MDYFKLMTDHPELFEEDPDELSIKIVRDRETIEAWRQQRLEELAEKHQPAAWADIGVILDDPYYIVIRDLVRFPSGRMNGYNRILGRANLSGGQGVVVLPVYDGKILVLHQYRHPTRSWEYEIPRGFGESHTSAAEQARTEIQEEIMGHVRALHDIGIIKENTGGTTHPVALFMADLDHVGTPSEDESIKHIHHLPIAEFESWIASGRISDGFTIAAYTRAKLNGLLQD